MSQPLYLDVDGTPAFCVLHRPEGEARDTAVLFVPPFGWEEVCSYRIVREWARRLAGAGFPVLRLTLPGCGDSGGSPRDPGRLEAWTAAVTEAARAVRVQTGAAAVVAVGLGLGGMLACRAAEAGAPIDGLVLWATPARGRDLTRQLKAFARLEASQVFEGLPDPPPLSGGEMEVGGFLLSAETQAELGTVDLGALALPRGLARGVLLLERDGIAIDERLRDALAGQGVPVDALAGEGYGEMTSHPQRNQLPETVVGEVMAWLERGDASAPPPAPLTGEPAVAVSEAAVLKFDGVEIVETPLTVPQEFGNLSAILTTPAAGGQPLCLVMLNAGAIRRIGPNRMWVEAARRWAARGVPSLRLDVEAIGEADGAVSPYADDNSLYVDALIPQVEAAIAFLAERGVAKRFATAGLCAGAYWAMYAGLDDPRVTAALMFNSRGIVWDTGISASRDLRRAFSQKLTWARIRHNVTGPRLRAVLHLLLRMPSRWLARRRGGQDPGSLGERVNSVMRRLQAAPLRSVFLFSAGEPLEEELINGGWLPQIEDWPNMTVTRVAVRDHTLRPLMAQQAAHAALDRAVEAELAAAAPSR
ncbi:MAG TPA: alpha/beta fold hydrolase [Solirubrobacteraceae bacterium]|jgi:pimeloyl-ACP methyl ester carboxylesterase|nr:alpha/beta fold hydrolase [Solirubrobacteraceae bacterium]